MPVEFEIGEEARDVLDSMAAYYMRVIDGYLEFGKLTEWDPRPISACQHESELLLRQYGPDAYWDGSEATKAAATAGVFLAAASEHLRGIVCLLREYQVIFPLAPLARAVMEIAGRVGWLLDRRIGVRDRVARILLMRIDDFTRAKTTALSLDSDAAPKWGQSVRDLRKVYVPSHFYPSEITVLPSGKFELRKQTLPGLAEGMRYVQQIGTEWNAPGFYNYLSDATHPTLHNALEKFKRRPVGPDDDDSVPQGYVLHLPDMAYPYDATRAVVLTFMDIWDLLASYLGITEPNTTDLRSAIEELPAPG